MRLTSRDQKGKNPFIDPSAQVALSSQVDTLTMTDCVMKIGASIAGTHAI